MGKFLGGLAGKLIGNFVGIAIIGAGIYYSLTKIDNIVERFERPHQAIRLFNETYAVPIRNRSRYINQENIIVKADIDKEENTLYFEYSLKDFNQNQDMNYTKRWQRNINHSKTKVFIIHPENVKIKKSQQRAYLISTKEEGWKKLKPFEEHKEAQKVFEGGDQIIEFLVSKIPFGKQEFDSFVKWYGKKENEYYNQRGEEAKENKNYVITRIPSHIPKKVLGYTEEAREYKIPFDLEDIKEKARMCLLADIFTGDASKEWGRLEKIVKINFSLEEKKTKEKIEYNKNFEVYQKITDGNTDIFIKDGKKEIPLVQHPAQDMAPVLSPDKKKVAFNSNRNNETAIYVININSSNLKKIINISKWDILNEIKWSSDSEKIIKITHIDKEWGLKRGDWQVVRPGYKRINKINVNTGEIEIDNSELYKILKEESER